MEWRAAYFTNSLFIVYFGFDVGTAQAVYSCEAPPTGSDCYVGNMVVIRFDRMHNI